MDLVDNTMSWFLSFCSRPHVGKLICCSRTKGGSALEYLRCQSTVRKRLDVKDTQLDYEAA